VAKKKIDCKGTACCAHAEAGSRRGRRIRRVSASPAGTLALAARFARLLPPGAVVFLEGPLGVGKTVFVQGMAGAFGLDAAAVHSPSFLLMHQYGQGRMVHIDCYRLLDASEGELMEMGMWEALEEPGIKVIEWPPLALRRRRRKAFWVRFKFGEKNHRVIDLPDLVWNSGPKEVVPFRK